MASNKNINVVHPNSSNAKRVNVIIYNNSNHTKYDKVKTMIETQSQTLCSLDSDTPICAPSRPRKEMEKNNVIMTKSNGSPNVGPDYVAYLLSFNPIIVYVTKDNNNSNIIGFALITVKQASEKQIKIRFPKYINANPRSKRNKGLRQIDNRGENSKKANIPEHLYINLICGKGNAKIMLNKIDEICKTKSIDYIGLHALKNPMMIYRHAYGFQFAEVEQDEHPFITNLCDNIKLLSSLKKKLKQNKVFLNNLNTNPKINDTQLLELQCKLIENLEFHLADLNLYDDHGNFGRCVSPENCSTYGYTMYKTVPKQGQKRARNNGATNNGATNNGATNNGATNNGATRRRVSPRLAERTRNMKNKNNLNSAKSTPTRV